MRCGEKRKCEWKQSLRKEKIDAVWKGEVAVKKFETILIVLRNKYSENGLFCL